MKNSKISHAKGQLCRAFQKRRKAAITHKILSKSTDAQEFFKKRIPLKNQDNKKRMNGTESSLITHVLPSGVSISDRLTVQASLDPI